jgi:hypothetical protein
MKCPFVVLWSFIKTGIPDLNFIWSYNKMHYLLSYLFINALLLWSECLGSHCQNLFVEI